MDAQVPAVVAGRGHERALGRGRTTPLGSLAAQRLRRTLRPRSRVRRRGSRPRRAGRGASCRTPSSAICPGGPGTPQPPTKSSGIRVEGAASSCSATTTSRWTPTRSIDWSRSPSAPTRGSCRRNWSIGKIPNVLLHVGMNCDKTGAVVDRIHAGRSRPRPARRGARRLRGAGWVHPHPGRPLAVNSNGFDAGIVAMGEDLDLSWRVPGGRVAGRGRARCPGPTPRGRGERAHTPRRRS